LFSIIPYGSTLRRIIIAVDLNIQTFDAPVYSNKRCSQYHRPTVDLKSLTILLQNLTYWLRCGGNTQAKFYGNRSRGVRPTNS